MSLDDYIFRSLSFEADQRKNSLNLPKNKDLDTFLFTIPSKSKVIPTFTANIEPTSTISLKRRYYIDILILHTRKRNKIKKPAAVVARASVAKDTLIRRKQKYIVQQKIDQSYEKFKDNENIIGLPVSNKLIALSRDIALNIQDGTARPITKDSFKPEDPTSIDALSLKKEIEVVQGVDQEVLEFSLQTATGPQPAPGGFLIEVFLSGSDGTLTKIDRNEVINGIDDATIEDGFSEFLNLQEE
jgi:hypothetical protein